MCDPRADDDPLLRFRLLTLPLFLVAGPLIVVGSVMGFAPPGAGVRRELLRAAFLSGFYLGALAWLIAEACRCRVGADYPRRLLRAPGWRRGLEGGGATALNLVAEGTAIVSLLLLLAVFQPQGVERILDAMERLGAARDPTHPPARALSWTTGMLLGPAVEEAIFRGVLFHRFAARRGIRAGLVISSLIFGLMHGPLAVGATMFGILMGLLYLRSGSLVLPILCHVLNNATSTIAGALVPPGPDAFALARLRADGWQAVAIAAVTVPAILFYLWKRWPARNAALPAWDVGEGAPQGSLATARDGDPARI